MGPGPSSVDSDQSDQLCTLFFSSAVLPDGKVAIQGGEYNCPSANCADAWQSNGALYDPAANTWTAITPEITSSYEADGDARR